MKKKIDKKYKDLIIQMARDHAYNIGYSHFKMDCSFAEENKETNHGQVAAEMNVQRRYLTCHLIVYPLLEKIYKEEGIDGLNKVIAHEIAHIATIQMHELTLQPYKSEEENKDAWESLTEVIGRLSVKIVELESKKK